MAGTLDQVVLAYDSLDNRTLLSDPDKGVREYAYNALGEELCALDERQMAVQQIYDGAGRVIHQRDLRNVASVQSCSGTLDKEAVWRYGHDVNQRQNFGVLLSENDNFVERLFSYDPLGRQVSMRTRFLTRGSTSFLQSSTYDEFGRVYQRFDGGPNQSGLRYVYNERGYQVALREADDPSVVYQQIIQRDAFGNISAELLGNGLTTTRVYDRRGYLRQLQTLGAGLRVQDLQMTYDPVGNLTERHDYKSASSAGYQHEVIRYDALNRLLWVDLQLGNSPSVQTMTMNYDAGGRILSKEGISYGYDTALPVHAVKSRGNQSYFYDVNGNQTQRVQSENDRTITYTHFDKPAHVWVEGHREESRYTYSPQRGRLERESWHLGVLQERYWFLGSLDVVVTNPSATNPSEIRYEYRRQIDGIAQVQIENGSETLKYFHYDHLGSVTAISDQSPNINNTQFSDYDAFGRRRHAQLWQLPITTNILNNVTEYGFGGHESRDELGLVHMNGRTYDPDVGQMMQADAVVQSPMDGQNYNRYAYVFNNPLSYTDPTGYFASIPDLFFSTFFRYESNFGPVTGNSSDMQKAEKNMKEKGEPAAGMPGVAETAVAANGNGSKLDQVIYNLKKGIAPNIVELGERGVEGGFTDNAIGFGKSLVNNTLGLIESGYAINPLTGSISMAFGGVDLPRASVADNELAGAALGDAAFAIGGSIRLGSRLLTGLGRSKTTRNILNLGSGDNPLKGAINLDIRALDGVDVVASAERLPFQAGVFDEVHSINPFGFNPVSAETARVMRPGGILQVTGSASNRYARPLSSADARAMGFEVVSTESIIQKHLFGMQKTTTGNILDTSNSLTTTYRRLD